MTPIAPPASLYEQLLGPAYAQLPLAVQRFHRLSGSHRLQGWVRTQAPASWGARVLAWCVRTPHGATQGELAFELTASPTTETWVRHFPSQTMRSVFRVVKSGEHLRLQERLGAATLHFELRASPQGLDMVLHRMWFLGVPCPHWLMPRIRAHEQQHPSLLNRFEFDVSASLPVLGTIAHYQGHLMLPDEPPHSG